MLFIKNEDIELAFVAMLNKLIFARKLLLVPLLQRLKNQSDDDGMQEIRELEKKLLQINEQRDTLQRLMAQGYLDQILFTQQKNELLTQAEECRQRIELIQNSSGNSAERLQALADLLHFAEHSPLLRKYDEELFTRFADRVIIYSREELGFKLKCGLTLKERM